MSDVSNRKQRIKLVESLAGNNEGKGPICKCRFLPKIIVKLVLKKQKGGLKTVNIQYVPGQSRERLL